MKTLAFAASTSKTSINHELVSYAAALMEDANVVKLIDFEMPLFSIDIEEKDGIPQKALNLSALIDTSDLIMISFAEHNGAYAAVFKNTFDWLSRIKGRKAWGDKKMFLMATSPGERGGASVLEMAVNRFPRNGGTIVGSFSLPSFEENFKDGKITNSDLDTQLKSLLAAL